MEIELEEYYRTKNGKIHKWSKGRTYIGNDEIVKHSKNIINLVEVGDYVNGERITDKWETRISSIKSNFSEEDIKTIVTHEQMASIEYKVEEDK